MVTDPKQLRQFGKFRLDAQKKVLWHEDEPVSLPLKEIELLCALTENVGEVVTKEELFNKVWAESFVEESNLSRHIYLLRKTFKDFGEDQELIQTVPRRGYRFAGRVMETQPGELVIEKHTLSRTLIEEVPAEQLRGKHLHRLGAKGLISAIALLLVVTAGAVIVNRGTSSGSKRSTFGSTANGSIKTIAILPFGTDSQSDELTNLVAKRLESEPSISLVAPQDVAAQKLSRNNILLAGRALKADAVLTGYVFEFEPSIHLRLHLIGINGGEVLSAITFNQPRNDQSSLVDSIAGALKAALQQLRSNEEYEQIARRHTANREAYQLYLQGQSRFVLRNDLLAADSTYFEDVDMTEPLRQAIALDPNFALAYVALANHYKAQDFKSQEWRRGEEYALRAINLDPTLAEPHAILGFIRMFHYWDWAAAESEFKRAIELDPNCVTAHQWYALFHGLRGNTYESQVEISKAYSLAPYSLSIYYDKAELSYYAGKIGGYDGAIYFLQEGAKLYPTTLFFSQLLKAFWMTGRFEDANNIYAQLSNYVGKRLSPQERAREFAGPRKGSKEFESISHPTTYNHALWHAVINQREEALDLLEEAYRDHHFFMIYIKAEPFFNSLRDEPRFRELERKVGLAQ